MLPACVEVAVVAVYAGQQPWLVVADVNAVVSESAVVADGAVVGVAVDWPLAGFASFVAADAAVDAAVVVGPRG